MTIKENASRVRWLLGEFVIDFAVLDNTLNRVTEIAIAPKVRRVHSSHCGPRGDRPIRYEYGQVYCP
jgi:hypothetical protein